MHDCGSRCCRFDPHQPKLQHVDRDYFYILIRRGIFYTRFPCFTAILLRGRRSPFYKNALSTPIARDPIAIDKIKYPIAVSIFFACVHSGFICLFVNRVNNILARTILIAVHPSMYSIFPLYKIAQIYLFFSFM